MASSYSALKIELMATGEDDQIWGDKTNQNWLAMQQAISNTGVATFASADQALTLVDSSALQPARALRLYANGTSGGARTLTVPATEKFTLFDNGCADAITLKAAGGGAGLAVPAGHKTLAYNITADVISPIDYLPALTLGGNLTVNGAGSFSGPLNGQPITVGPLPVNYNGMRMDSDGATFSRYYFNYGQNTVFNYNWSTQALTYIVNGTVAATFSNNGNLTIPGTITAPYGSFTQQVTAGVVGVGDVSMYFQTDTVASYINLNGFNCRLQYTKASGLLQYVVNNKSVAAIDLNGSVTATGSVVSGPGGRMQLNPDGTYQNLFFDSNNAYLQYNTSNQALYYVTAGTIRMTILTNGDTTFAANVAANVLYSSSVQCTGGIACKGVDAQGGVIYCGSLRPTDINTGSGITCGPLQTTQLGCSGQGFFTGNLNAATNYGQNANAVVTGFYQDAAWFNGQTVGAHVSGTVGIIGYATSNNIQWSTSASDRRLKENIKRPSLDPLDVVRKLPIWSCDYIAPRPKDADLERPEIWPQVREHWPFSFMADEVDAAMPNATIKDDDGRAIALHPQHLIATLWAAVQQLTDRLESSEAKLAALGAA
jgi:hypothetical protein